MADFIRGMIGLVVGIVLYATVFVATVKATNTSTWTAAEVSMWGLLTLVGTIGIVYGVLNVFGIA